MNKSPARVVFEDSSSVELDRNNTKVLTKQDDGSIIEQTLATVEVKNLVIVHEKVSKKVQHIVNL